VESVTKKLPGIDKSKVGGPDALLAWLLKTYADTCQHDLKPKLLNIIDLKQFGFSPGSSTKFSLISMLHKWLAATDGTGPPIGLFYWITGKRLVWLIIIFWLRSFINMVLK
jgi:hypothetical protein